MINSAIKGITALGALILPLVLFFASTPSYANCEQSEVSVHCGKTPTSTFDRQGKLWTAFVQNKFVYVSHSDDKGQQYSRPVKVNQAPQSIYTNGENRPKIQIGTGNNVFVSWTEKTPGRFTGDIRFARSADGGQYFEPIQKINDDGLPIGHRFDAMTVTPSGLIYIAWLDKRDSVAAKENGQDYAGISLYYATSSDHGATFSPNIKVAEHTCECCRIAITNTSSNSATVMWRHIFTGGYRDHAIATLNPDKPSSIKRATVDLWKTNACPHHGPSIDSTKQGQIHLAWFSNGERHKGIYYGMLKNEDDKTSHIFSVDTSPQASHPQVKQLSDTVWLAWKTFERGETHIKTRFSLDNGTHWSAPASAATTAGNSDHPLLIHNNKTMFVAWQTSEQGLRLIPLNTGINKINNP